MPENKVIKLPKSQNLLYYEGINQILEKFKQASIPVKKINYTLGVKNEEYQVSDSIRLSLEKHLKKLSRKEVELEDDATDEFSFLAVGASEIIHVPKIINIPINIELSIRDAVYIYYGNEIDEEAKFLQVSPLSKEFHLEEENEFTKKVAQILNSLGYQENDELL